MNAGLISNDVAFRPAPAQRINSCHDFANAASVARHQRLLLEVRQAEAEQAGRHAVRRIFAGLADCRSVQDVPCGAGRFMKTLAGDGCRALGVDSTREILVHAQKRVMQLGVTKLCVYPRRFAVAAALPNCQSAARSQKFCTMADKTEISIVLACHNELANLRPLVEAIRAAVGPLKVDYEIIFTDDCSDDGSWDTLRELATAQPRLRAQRLAVRSGQSAALWAGIRAARGRVIVTLDADLQNDPADIPELLAALKQADCVCGTRVDARRHGDNWVRIASSRIANWVRNKLSGESVTDAGCCFRAFRRKCVAEVKFFRGAHRFLPTLIKMEGYSVVEVPIRHHPRVSGRTHYGIGNRLFPSFADLLAVRWMKKRHICFKVTERIN